MSSKRLKGKALMIVVSSPSGGGKSTLCRKLLSEYEGIEYSISCTTRKPRGEEKDGVNYHFMSPSAFSTKLDQGCFLENAEVHGNMYGTLRSTVEDAIRSGRSVILDIDVQGAAQIRRIMASDEGLLKNSYLDIFIAPPSMEELRARLEKRGEDSPETIELRLRNAEQEMRCADDYRYVIENDDLERAYAELVSVLEKESSL